MKNLIPFEHCLASIEEVTPERTLQRSLAEKLKPTSQKLDSVFSPPVPQLEKVVIKVAA